MENLASMFEHLEVAVVRDVWESSRHNMDDAISFLLTLSQTNEFDVEKRSSAQEEIEHQQQPDVVSSAVVLTDASREALLSAFPPCYHILDAPLRVTLSKNPKVVMASMLPFGEHVWLQVVGKVYTKHIQALVMGCQLPCDSEIPFLVISYSDRSDWDSLDFLQMDTHLFDGGWESVEPFWIEGRLATALSNGEYSYTMPQQIISMLMLPAGEEEEEELNEDDTPCNSNDANTTKSIAEAVFPRLGQEPSFLLLLQEMFPMCSRADLEFYLQINKGNMVDTVNNILVGNDIGNDQVKKKKSKKTKKTWRKLDLQPTSCTNLTIQGMWNPSTASASRSRSTSPAAARSRSISPSSSTTATTSFSALPPPTQQSRPTSLSSSSLIVADADQSSSQWSKVSKKSKRQPTKCEMSSEEALEQIQSHCTVRNTFFRIAASAFAAGDTALAKSISTRTRQLNAQIKNLSGVISRNIQPRTSAQQKPSFVDLHGMYAAEAVNCVQSVLSHCRQQSGEFLVDFCTGKGKHSEGGPVLRTSVKECLDTQRIKYQDLNGIYRVWVH